MLNGIWPKRDYNITSIADTKILYYICLQIVLFRVMKKFIPFTYMLLWGVSLFAQQLEGTFKNGLDSLTFDGENIVFRISGFGGLSSAQVGEGSYEYNDDYLFIHTRDFSGERSVFQELEGYRTDTCVVKVVSLYNYPIENILVESLNKSDKNIEAKVTGDDGKIILTQNNKISSIAASSIGYNSISFNYTQGKDYLVRLAEHEIVENRTVIFKIQPIDDETISVLLLTDNFDEGKNRDKELKKLEKKAMKNNMLDKRLKKVYIPHRMIH